MTRTAAAALAIAIAAFPASAQGPSFEAASVRPNTSGDLRMRATTQGRAYIATNMPLDRIIATAYGLQATMFRLGGGPPWMRSERFDVTATLPGNTTVRDVPLLLQTLLADRFKLVVRRETRDAPAYALVLARNDGQPGPRLRASVVDCTTPVPAGQPAPPPRPECQTQVDSNIQGRGQPLTTLARLLPSFVDRPVFDLTGLKGAFDFDLTIPPQGTAAGIDAGGGVFTAIQEQLGLKLESIQAPVEFVVIQSIERPGAD